MTFDESGMSFEFRDQHWTFLIQYDESRDFLNLRDAVPQSKAVDFIGILDEETLALFEIKNFRGSRIANKPRVEQGEDPLDVEFGQKVRDTVSGIIGGARNSTHLKVTWNKYLSYLRKQNLKVEAVLWLEEDFLPSSFPEKRKKARSDAFRKDLKKALGWLTGRVFLCNRNDHPYESSLNVDFL